MEELDVEDVRANNLNLWIKYRFGGSQSFFADTYKLNRPEVSELLSGKRTFTTKKARSIESLASMPETFLDYDSRNKYSRAAHFIPVIDLCEIGIISKAISKSAELEKLQKDKKVVDKDLNFNDPIQNFLAYNIRQIPNPLISSNKTFAVEFSDSVATKLSSVIFSGSKGLNCTIFCDVCDIPTLNSNFARSPRITFTPDEVKQGVVISISIDGASSFNFVFSEQELISSDSLTQPDVQGLPFTAVIVGVTYHL